MYYQFIEAYDTSLPLRGWGGLKLSSIFSPRLLFRTRKASS